MRPEHFQRWPHQFHDTVHDLYQGPVAELAKKNGERMAAMFLQRLPALRQHP